MGTTATGAAAAGRRGRARLRYGWGFENSDFAFYGGAASGTDLDRFLGYHWYRYRVRPALNDPWSHAVTEDKWVFSRLMDSFGLPAARTLGLYDPTYGTSFDLERPLRTAADLAAELRLVRPDGVVLKPVRGNQGRGVVVLDSVDHETGRAVTRAGEETTLEQALAGLGGDAGPSHIVQERLRNHPLLDEIAPYATNTVRVQTLLSDAGEVLVLGAVLRVARRGTAVDNFSQGGLAVQVDRDTGVTGVAITKQHTPAVSRHPDSGAELAGRQLPFWAEVHDLVRRGARCLTGLHGVGWDIALTPTGPVVVEANDNWDLQLVQAHSGGYLADPEFRAWMTDLGVPLPTGNVVTGHSLRPTRPVRARLRR